MYVYEFAVPLKTKISDLVTDIFYEIKEGDLKVTSDDTYRLVSLTLYSEETLQRAKSFLREALKQDFILISEYSRKMH